MLVLGLNGVDAGIIIAAGLIVGLFPPTDFERSIFK